MTEQKKVEEGMVSNSREANENTLIDFVIQTVCKYYEQPPFLMTVRTRKSEIVKCRQIIMYLILKNSKASLMTIARKFMKNHATVIHSKKIIGSYLDWDKELQVEVGELQNLIELKAKSIIHNLDLKKDFYYIDLNNFHSARHSEDRAIILTGFTKDEVENMVFIDKRQLTIADQKNSWFKTQKVDWKEHRKMGMHVLEKNKDEDENNGKSLL